MTMHGDDLPADGAVSDRARTVGVARRSRFAVLAAVALVMVSACSSGGGGNGFSFNSPGGRSDLSYTGQDRQALPEISGPNVSSNDRITLSDFAGKVVVLNFWGSWCPPCRAEAPELAGAARSLVAQQVQFLGVDIRDTKQAGTDFQTAFDVPYPSIFDPTMRTLLALRGYPSDAIPSTIVLDRSHRVAQIWLRPVTEREVVATVSAIAAESG